MKVKESLAEEVPTSNLHVMEMDLSSLDSVRSFARSFNSSHKHLNVLMYVNLASSETLQMLERSTEV
jgi:short-subunit dehydrogenase involved in D-alanine esterification of teichoic acids